MTRAIVWLLALALPFRALTAMYLDLQGPLHFHHHHHDDEHHEHGHDHPERHHHPAGDRTVIGVEGEPLAAEEAAARGWSATMCVALVSVRAWPDLPRLGNGFASGNETRLRTRHLGRLERPPRTNHA